MLAFYLQYKNINMPKNITKKIKLSTSKNLNMNFFFLQKQIFSHRFHTQYTHTLMFYLYKNLFLKLAVKKKQTSVKDAYFIQFQQYIY